MQCSYTNDVLGLQYKNTNLHYKQGNRTLTENKTKNQYKTHGNGDGSSRTMRFVPSWRKNQQSMETIAEP